MSGRWWGGNKDARNFQRSKNWGGLVEIHIYINTFVNINAFDLIGMKTSWNSENSDLPLSIIKSKESHKFILKIHVIRKFSTPPISAILPHTLKKYTGWIKRDPPNSDLNSQNNWKLEFRNTMRRNCRNGRSIEYVRIINKFVRFFWFHNMLTQICNSRRMGLDAIRIQV